MPGIHWILAYQFTSFAFLDHSVKVVVRHHRVRYVESGQRQCAGDGVGPIFVGATAGDDGKVLLMR